MADQQQKPQWYQKEVESINPEAQRLLENYSGITPAEVLPHVLKLEIRFLADQGIPGKQLYGIDLEQAFLDLGYQLFLDKDRLQSTFIAGDILAPEKEFEASQLSQEISGKIDIIFASSLFHLWDCETQLKAAVRLVSLCRDQPDVMVVGRQMGSLLGGHYPMSGVNDEFNHYRHNVETMKGLWRDVEEATQTRWKVEAQLYIGDEIAKVMKSPFADEHTRMVPWCATRQ